MCLSGEFVCWITEGIDPSVEAIASLTQTTRRGLLILIYAEVLDGANLGYSYVLVSIRLKVTLVEEVRVVAVDHGRGDPICLIVFWLLSVSIDEVAEELAHLTKEA